MSRICTGESAGVEPEVLRARETTALFPGRSPLKKPTNRNLPKGSAVIEMGLEGAGFGPAGGTAKGEPGTSERARVAWSIWNMAMSLLVEFKRKRDLA